jgi:sugar-specific transcriptional regulator TrmB
LQNGDKAALESKTQVLAKLGLTSMQAKLYACLHASGKTQAKTLSNLCRLPRQDIYKTLAELYEIGLLEKTLTRPVEFKAISTSQCFSILIQRRKQKNSEIEQLAKEVLRIPEKRPLIKDSSDSASLLLVPKREPTLIRARNLIDSAQSSICVVSPHQNLFPWIDKEAKAIEKALTRHVKVRFVTDSQGGTSNPKEAYRIFQNGISPEIRFVERPPTASFGIYDGKRIILELSTNDGFLGSDTLVTENASLVDMATAYFQVMWRQAK